MTNSLPTARAHSPHGAAPVPWMTLNRRSSTYLEGRAVQESGATSQNGVLLDFTRPGKPTDNCLCESFNRRLRDECLNITELTSIEEAKTRIEAWRVDCNEHRPHGALGQLTPSEHADRGQETPLGAANS